MPADYRPYVIKQGDYLTKLAFTHGFDPTEVWSHEKNKALAASRTSMDMLAPGDIVYLPVAPKPGLPFTPGTTNKYRGKVPSVELTLSFMNVDATPMADEPFVLTGGRTSDGSDRTTADGKVTLSVPVTTREVTLEFPQRNQLHRVRIGDLDPPTEPSGVRQRLVHLGYLYEPDDTSDLTDEQNEARLAEALRQLQIARGLPETGALDDATRKALEEAHGV